MKRILTNRTTILLSLATILTAAALLFTGAVARRARASNAPQTLPFSQNWTNTGLITTSDDWGGVPGIVGFRGDDLTTSTGVDPRTLLADGSATPVDVNANQTNPDTFATGGLTEFEIANPVVAIFGSGTADAPHMVLYLNTTGQSSIAFACNVRDIDNSTDNAVQQIDVQYRVGGAGNYASVPGGYIADATTGPSQATLVTPLNLTLPAAADNQPLVEIRILTTNAVGNDEAVGIDDISVTGGPPLVPGDANADFNGDGKTDWTVTRGLSELVWYTSANGSGATTATQFGDATTDIQVPEDYDGDGKDDIAVWRPGAPTIAAFYILESATSTVRADQFGQTGDDPRITGDYDGDGKSDVATFRCPPSASGPGQCYFYYRPSAGTQPQPINYVPWGFGAASEFFPNPGDYDGDGKYDFCLQRTRPQTATGGQFVLLRSSDGGVEFVDWGDASDLVIPGDYDGDGKSDFCVQRTVGGSYIHYILERDGGGTGATGIQWGVSLDLPAPGDYDGDGKQDIAVWRGGSPGVFYVRRSSDGGLLSFPWGQSTDLPPAGWYVH